MTLEQFRDEVSGIAGKRRFEVSESYCGSSTRSYFWAHISGYPRTDYHGKPEDVVKELRFQISEDI